MEERSVHRAKLLGGDNWQDFFGYSNEAIRLDNLFDAIIYLASAAGHNNKAKYRNVARRPGDAPRNEPPKKRVMSFDLDDPHWGAEFASLR